MKPKAHAVLGFSGFEASQLNRNPKSQLSPKPYKPSRQSEKPQLSANTLNPVLSAYGGPRPNKYVAQWHFYTCWAILLQPGGGLGREWGSGVGRLFGLGFWGLSYQHACPQQTLHIVLFQYHLIKV